MHIKRFHNIFDLENCNEKIGDEDVLRKFLEDVANAVDMKILKGPIMAESVADNPGISALVIIDFSHISIHTFTKNSEALIDIFSCKEYDKNAVLKVCKNYFAKSETRIRQKEVWWG